MKSKYAKYNKDNLDSFISSVNSYLGLIKHYKTYKIRKKFVRNQLAEWLPYVKIGKNYMKITKQHGVSLCKPMVESGAENHSNNS